ncbi:protein-L-isoaspartate O-methyltransferase [Uliginosibacterium sp. H3]|uniref:Protein-L-isoaspartate O-methyltransferase n=1 Tax=Uliginosibacterium silvisoli TaxID=3114758 RepID=A0ABU6K3I0_9RHOO|nr:protein-L-isoaspartate O-methyltransferase [Uliginosibacterium sp. H3]
MDFEHARFNMIEQQIRPWDVLDPDVLNALRSVKRELFVLPEHQALAFGEVQLPIGCGQSMLEPKVEAKALQAIGVKSGDSILEIGTGSGYMAALLAVRGEWVRSVEIEPQLVRFAVDNLARNEIDNVIVEEGDGLAGLPARAPYDVIMVSGAVREISQAWLDQLKTGGRLFAFVGTAPVMKGQLVQNLGDGQFRSSTVFETLVPYLRTAQAPSFAF